MGDKEIGWTFELGDLQVWLHFEPRDLWVGCYWRRDEYTTEIYICLLPALPIRFMWFHPQSEQTEVTEEEIV